MPEGHTLHRLADEVTRRFAGQVVSASSPQGRFAGSAALIDHTVLLDAQTWGKHLFVEFEADRFVHIHLGLYGRFVFADGPAPAPVGLVRLRIATPQAYGDLRGATTCELITAERREEVLAGLGPDPLRPEADGGRAVARILASRAPIGGLLMDQSVLGGVGNVYRAELLFRHRIHPLRPGNTLRRSQLQSMWDDLVALMHQGVRTGRIDTVRDEHTPEAMGRPPRVDDHGGEVYVYRRNGMACHVCGATVRTQVLQGRNLFWCPRCQPKFRSRAHAS